MGNYKRLKTFLETWKPIHLCWWFEKRGWEIPKYFIGGGSKPPVYASGNIDNATRNLGNTVNVPVTDWNKANDFIVAIALEAQSGAVWANTNLQLEWRNKTDSGTFAPFSGSSELRLGSTDLVEGNSLDSGEAICVPVNGATYVAGSPNGGVEKETSSTFTGGDGGTTNQWSEFQISVDASNALDDKEYEFRVWDVDNSAILGPSLATITMIVAGTIESTGNSRIANEFRVWQGIENWDIDEWVKANPFIFAAVIQTETDKRATKTFQLRWRNVTEAGSFVALSATGELNWTGATNLINDDALTSPEAGCTPLGTRTWMDGIEREGANDAIFDNPAMNIWSEYHWAIDCSGAQDGDIYEFQLYNVTDAAPVTTCYTTIIMAAAGPQEFFRSIYELNH